MFPIKKPEPRQPSHLDELIDHHISEMDGFDRYSDEYKAMVQSLKTLYEVKLLEEKPNRPSADMILTVAGNLTGILSILFFEQTHVVTSKALSHVLRPRA